MKKLLPILTGACICSSQLLAQAPQKNVFNQPVKIARYHHVSELYEGKPVSNTQNGHSKSTDVFIGNTSYQLQSNSSVQNRIVHNTDHTISAVTTFSNTASTGGWPDRGTGYWYYDGTTWSAAPNTRVEAVRTGWPSVLVLGDNSEVVICHNTQSLAAYDLYFMKRPVKGTGTWTENASIIANTPAPYGNLWPRAVAGGTNNMTIHLISLVNPVDGSDNDVFYLGQQGAITYSRSTDGGTTWDILHSIPSQHDSTQYRGFSADSYALDARGNTVAYVVGGEMNDLFLMKSTDNGSTWNKTVIRSFPIPFFDDQLIDTTETNDGTVAVILDTNDVAHVFYGAMMVLNDNNTDGQYSYFPGTSGIMYWNEGMGSNPPVLIADLEDLDNSGAIDIAAYGTYYNSLTSFCSAGLDEQNNIHLTYAAAVENSDDGDGKSVRNIYYTKSGDGGNTWVDPVRVNADEYSEQVYCSITRNVDPTCISMLYQSDIYAGHGVGTGNPDEGTNASSVADVVYVCYELFSGVNEYLNLSEQVSIYPNPSAEMVNINSLYMVDRVELMGLSGKIIASYTVNGQQTQINVGSLPSGMYLMNIYSEGAKAVRRLVKK